MKSKEEILSILRGLKEYLKDKYFIIEIGAFGSLMRGEETQDSDLDLLIDFKDGASLFTLTSLASFLEEKLQMKVDIIPKHALREEIKKSVFKDMILL